MSSFSTLGINHIGLAPKDPEKARWFFSEVLGLNLAGEEHVKDQMVKTVMFDTGHNSNQTRMEILIPDGNPDSPIAKYLEKKGSGIHHVAVGVDNVEAALKRVIDLGVETIDKTPRPGAHNTKIAFIHPRATGGLLIELVQQL